MIGIGIDTGGTCTDAVIYDTEKNQVLAWAKDLTTKRDLKVGISNVLKKLPEDQLKLCTHAALSTTLATNACVENIGGNGRLVFIGIDEEVLQDTYASYGYQSLEDVYVLKCKITDSQKESEEPDWENFKEDMEDFLKGADCVSIVQLFSAAHLGAYEKKAAEVIKGLYPVPIILGKDLFLDLNAIKRGAGALLNARLVPLIYQFVQAIDKVFLSMGMEIPTTIIRSDGSQMSKKFASLHPVETLLSGPAASIVGGISLTEIADALIVDMGGTTTDIAIVKNGIPKEVEKGIQIGNWKTFVKGVYIDTFGLGGDTAIHYKKSSGLYLENYRVVPICSLASRYPYVLTELKALVCSDTMDSHFAYEYICLLKDIEQDDKYNKDEKALCRAVTEKPLSIREAAKVLNSEFYIIKRILTRLEEDGIIIRSGLTPTDIMHIKGDYTEFNKEASIYAARLVCQSYYGKELEELCDSVYEMVEKRLYENIARIILTTECEELKNETLDAQSQSLIHYSYQLAKKGLGECSLSAPLFQLKTKLVGVGAPMHIFLPEVARLFGTEAILPKYASVANAIGAIASKITVTVDVYLRPRPNREEGYDAVMPEEKRFFLEYEEACEFIKQAGCDYASQKAKERGAETVEAKYEVIRQEASTGYGVIWIEDIYRITATECTHA
ncbi:MAG: hydantoinase/oxoprolinase family protein [Lachnospiraceae bacterium]|nr:hydantoinase/oxoprolinase family protein [Lachnospiraceae bacterium]